MGKNTEAMGVIVLLLVLAGISGEKNGRHEFSLLKGFEPASLLGDFHKMVGVTNRLDNMGQMAAHPPKLPEPSQLINTDAIPNLDGLMEMVGPLLKNLNK